MITTMPRSQSSSAPRVARWPCGYFERELASKTSSEVYRRETMKPRKQPFREFLDQSFARFRNLPQVPTDDAWQRVLDRLQTDPHTVTEGTQPAIDSVRKSRSIVTRRTMWITAAALV